MVRPFTTLAASPTRRVAADFDVVGRHLVAVGVEEDDVGLPRRDPDEVGAARGADDGIGNRRVGDKNILRVARQIDHGRAADAKRKETRAVRTGAQWTRAFGSRRLRHKSAQEREQREGRGDSCERGD